ncbi:uncharacterized protein Dvir_GJ26664, isoform F [Drosophila virilis]|uniref:Uncharacterized protein, isoform F n=1 Tax=Drosophila virilis TaxID=7244 RepID=A0A0Q9WRB7_DROVI|nr:uncharacterized protein Dvir_GJ26664, isoform F [Drosophila virilis]
MCLHYWSRFAGDLRCDPAPLPRLLINRPAISEYVRRLGALRFAFARATADQQSTSSQLGAASSATSDSRVPLNKLFLIVASLATSREGCRVRLKVDHTSIRTPAHRHSHSHTHMQTHSQLTLYLFYTPQIKHIVVRR